MSHDRGCFRCGEDRWNYNSCTRKDCPKRPETPEEAAARHRLYQARQEAIALKEKLKRERAMG